MGVDWAKGSAATDWFPYRADSMFSPQEAEWCLWSTVIRGERNYFAGKLLWLSDRMAVMTDNRMYFEPDETTYWARIRKIQE